MGWTGPARIALLALAAALAACGDFSLDNDDHAWRAEAARRCLDKGMVQASAYVRPKAPINGRGVCGIARPFEISASLYGAVELDPGATLDCNMTAALEYWLETTVQPAAMQMLGAPVTGARVISSYSCRTRNSQRGAKMSEHAFGNAIDIAAFRLADGREVVVESGWRGRGPEAAFLRRIHGEACDTFRTVLGPDADAHHRDHLHLDLARHGFRRDARYCR